MEGIGYLLAAKSVFRFGELRNNKELMHTEYILLGTFLSFTVAVVVGLLAHRALVELVPRSRGISCEYFYSNALPIRRRCKYPNASDTPSWSAARVLFLPMRPLLCQHGDGRNNKTRAAR